MDKNRCSKCKSANTRVRIQSKERVCNHCGNIEAIEPKVQGYYSG